MKGFGGMLGVELAGDMRIGPIEIIKEKTMRISFQI
jgi:hypothetical protein